MATRATEPPIDSLPSFPLPREPLGPPPEFRTFRDDPWLTPVRMWDGKRAWLATRYDDCRTLLADPRFSANLSLPGFPLLNEGRAAIALTDPTPGLVRMDGAEHSRLRKMLQPEFTVRRVAAMRSATEEIANRLIDRLLEGPRLVDFAREFSGMVPALVLTRLLGVPESDKEHFQALSAAVLDNTIPPEENVVANERFHDYVRQLVRYRLTDPGDDLVSRITQTYIATGQLGEEEAIGNLQLLFLAGHETTAHTISMSLLLLTERPESFRAMAEGDDEFVRNAVEELLRYTSVVQYSCARLALDDVEFRGSVIRKGEGILPMIHAANRDPRRFDDPEELNIFRPVPAPQIAFGFGPHQCLGQSLARLELSIALPLVARRMPTLRLAGTGDDVKFKGVSLTYGLEKLMMAW